MTPVFVSTKDRSTFNIGPAPLSVISSLVLFYVLRVCQLCYVERINLREYMVCFRTLTLSTGQVLQSSVRGLLHYCPVILFILNPSFSPFLS